MIFVDTGAWFAAFVPNDPDHTATDKWLDSNAEPLIDCSFDDRLEEGAMRVAVKDVQGQYQYIEPLRLPAGTRIDLESYFDNSAANPYNPNQPPAQVGFGEQTTDEMCICAFRLIETGTKEDRQKLQAAIRQSLQQQLANPKVFKTVMEFLARGEGGDLGGDAAGRLLPLGD